MISRVVVCGAGTMGSGIAESCARAGFRTVLYDLDAGRASAAVAQVARNQETLVQKGKLSAADAAEATARLVPAASIRDCSGELIIEAIVERVDVKQDLFRTLAEVNDNKAVFATNTSSLSVAAIAQTIPHPERVCGLHFFNPAQVMKLVEVVDSGMTDAAIIARMVDFCRQLGKTPVVCKDSPGFIVNRVARHYYLEPLRLVEQGVCSIEQADALLEDAGFRMGPFRLMDLIGNDVNYAVTTSLYEASGHAERFRPSPIQRDKVEQGQLGRKTGKGYYDYP
jgi:3-hydroxybutyryl-CoA dehydrogenase